MTEVLKSLVLLLTPTLGIHLSTLDKPMYSMSKMPNVPMLSPLPPKVSTLLLPLTWPRPNLSMRRDSVIAEITQTNSSKTTNFKTISSVLITLDTSERMTNLSILMPPESTLTSSLATLERPSSQPWRKRPKFSKLPATAVTPPPNTELRDAPTTTTSYLVPWPKTRFRCKRVERRPQLPYALEETEARDTLNAETRLSSDAPTVVKSNVVITSVSEPNFLMMRPLRLPPTQPRELRKKLTKSSEMLSPRLSLNAFNLLSTRPLITLLISVPLTPSEIL